jgi:hypothetical protein
MEKSCGLFFFIKKSKNSKAIEHFIYLHITVDEVGKTPVCQFQMTLAEVERIALIETKLQILIAQQFPTDRLRVVRDIFLFSCYTGLAYANVKKLKRSEIIIGLDSEQWLVSRRQKTDISDRIPLLPAALTIIDRYKDHPQCRSKD